MAETQITYNYIKNLVLGYCKNNIYNLSTNDRRPAYYKNGQAYNDDKSGSGDYVVNLRFTRTTSNSVALVDESTINSELNSFLTSNLGLNEARLAKVVNDRNYMNYVIDLAIFYSTKVCLMTSNNFSIGSTPSGNKSILVYMSSNKTFNNLRPIDTSSIDLGEGTLTLKASDVITQLQAVINTIANATTRTVSNKINFSIALR